MDAVAKLLVRPTRLRDEAFELKFSADWRNSPHKNGAEPAEFKSRASCNGKGRWVNDAPQTTDFACTIEVAADGVPPAPIPAPRDEVADQLRELVGATRELVALSREQVEIAKRNEDRYQKQQQGQREEFQRWLADHDHLGKQCVRAQEVLRAVLGNAIRDLVDYIDEHEENLLESDFVRSDLIDRFGSVLNHVSAMYAVVKRLSVIEKTQQKTADET